MSRFDLEALELHCNTTSTLLEAFEDRALSWATYKEKLLRPYKAIMRRQREVLEKFPEYWQEAALAEATACQVFAYPARTRKLLRLLADELPDKAVDLLEGFARRPWFYCLFSIREKLGGSFFTIEDFEGETARLLYSPAVRDLERSGVRLFFCLLFDNGRCLQTYGLIHEYRGFQPYDFPFFARLLQPETYRTQGLAAMAAANPAAFQLLDYLTEIPPVVHRGELVEACDHELRLESFDAEKLAGEELALDSAGEVLRLSLKGEADPLWSACAFYDPHDKKLLVHATSMRLYARLRALLGLTVQVPEEPDWHASMNMVIAARQLLGKQPPSAVYVELFERQEHDEASAEQSEELGKLNALARELSDHHGAGSSYSLQELAVRHGVAEDTARQVEQAVRGFEVEAQVPLQGGLEGYRPPPPQVRQSFQASPWENSVFLFLDSPRVREFYASIRPSLSIPFAGGSAEGAFAKPPPESLDELPQWLEDLYAEAVQEHDYTLLNAALHLLCSRGGNFEPVRDYAVEVLRLFWELFAPDKEPQQFDRFVRRFSRFSYRMLHLGGLVDVDPPVTTTLIRKAEFSLRPSALLRAWARLRG